MDGITLTINIGPDSPPELISALKILATMARGNPDAVIVEETEQLEYVKITDFIEFLVTQEDPADPTARRKAKNKAHNALKQLLLGYVQEKIRRDGIALQAVLRCPYCHKDQNNCGHVEMVNTTHPVRYWHVYAPWEVGKDSLLDLEAENLKRIPKVSRQRLLDWIEHLRSQSNG